MHGYTHIVSGCEHYVPHGREAHSAGRPGSTAFCRRPSGELLGVCDCCPLSRALSSPLPPLLLSRVAALKDFCNVRLVDPRSMLVRGVISLPLPGRAFVPCTP